MDIVYPLEKKGVITSDYGPRGGGQHRGIDIGVPKGTNVKSIYDGDVVRSDMIDKDGYGNFIIIKHNIDGQTVYSGYAHLTKRNVNEGDKVKKGQTIGLSGGSQGKENGAGNSKKDHLHFEIRKSKDGNWINPESFLSGGIASGTIGDEISNFKMGLFGKEPIKIIQTPEDHAKRSSSDWSSSHAWDIQGPIGTSIFSLTKGKVSKIFESKPGSTGIFGTQLSIQGTDGYPSIFYTHIDNVKLEVGDEVQPGQYIGKITRWESNPSASHVHIGIDGRDIFDFMDKDGKIKNVDPELMASIGTSLDNISFLGIDFGKFFQKIIKSVKDFDAKNKKEYAKHKEMYEEVDRVKDIMKKVL
jgi:murein DD-endopeptidase MepM/ murein hydrolase activator NlpD